MPTVWPLDREAMLQRASEADLDVVVVGGGITGAGVALDASLRGYRVALVERGDLAQGTSSRSSKLVHGGLRYLAGGEVTMAVEGVRERDRTRTMAPHLVRPLPFVVPTPTAGDRLRLKAGLLAYDLLGVGRGVAPHARVDAAGVAAVASTLRGGSAGYRYWDARTDDARLTLAVAQAARRAGALVVNHAEATRIRCSSGGRVTGVDVHDHCSSSDLQLSTPRVVAAGGAWSAEIRELAPGGAWRPAVTAARGAHLVFRAEDLPVTQAVVFPSAAEDGRRLFVVPWGRQVYVGTNDVPTEDATPYVTDEDATYLLDAVAAAFADPPRLADAVGAWAGVRPLVGGGTRTADISRRHLVVEDPAGLISIIGGKLTTWRAMAQDVCDRLVAADGGGRRCRTVQVSLGATGSRRGGDQRMRIIGARHGVDPVTSSALYHRHGDAAPDVLAACLAEEDGLTPLVSGLPYVRGEVRWAVRHELARTVSDVLQRRTRVALRDAAAGGEVIDHVATVLDEELGIDVQQQRDRYLATVDAERGPVLLG